jgi:hypothetical protein
MVCFVTKKSLHSLIIETKSTVLVMVCVDLVGPFTIRTPAKTNYLIALTMIDPAISIQDLFHNTWLAHYPWSQFILFDDGSMREFKREFKQMYDNYGIQAKLTTSHNHINPQTNAISERVHKLNSC